MMLFLAGTSASRGDVFKVTNTNDVGSNSLRQAITLANLNPGSNRITFEITQACSCAVQTITLFSSLPPIMNVLTIDGATQPGYSGTPLIELDGSAITNNAGLELRATNNLIRALALKSFHGDGILIFSSGNIIESNVIAFNSGAGIRATNSTVNIFSRNSIFSNTGLGIDIENPEVPPNGIPVLTNAIFFASTTNTLVQGRFTAASNATYMIEFFSNRTGDPSGFGQGETFIASTTITTEAAGTSHFSTVVSDVVTTGTVITATATAIEGSTQDGPGPFLTFDASPTFDESTSEFSRWLVVFPEFTPELTGFWSSNLVARCAYTEKLQPYLKLRGKFFVTNEGTAPAPKTTVKFFLADGTNQSPADILLSTTGVRALATNQTRQVRFHGKLPVNTTCDGKFVLAVIDPQHHATEFNTNDNVIAFPLD